MSNLTKAEFKRPGADQHVCIATPAHTIHSNFHVSIIRSIPVLLDANISVTYAHLAGHCHVDDARNLLVADFLKTNATDLLFWDADVGAEPSAARRLLAHNADVVGGAYPLKNGSGRFPVRRLPKPFRDDWRADGLIEVEAIATGFLRIRRGVFEALRGSCVDVDLDDTSALVFFNRDEEQADYDPRRMVRVGGDMNFCRKWTAVGGKIFCDPSLLFTHQGAVDFAGRLSDHLQQREAAE